VNFPEMQKAGFGTVYPCKERLVSTSCCLHIKKIVPNSSLLIANKKERLYQINSFFCLQTKRKIVLNPLQKHGSTKILVKICTKILAQIVSPSL
jgi:hypothetical protein